MTEEWRPAAAYEVFLSDAELSQIGLMAALETQMKVLTCSALKGVCRLSFEQWRKCLEKPVLETIEKLKKEAAGIDELLDEIISRLDRDAKATILLRHQFVHTLFAVNEGGEPEYAYDWKRLEKVERKNLPDAVRSVALITFAARDCAYRTAELIAEGRLEESSEEKGPAIRTDLRLVRL